MDATSSTWIAIEVIGGGDQIVQIGFLHKFNASGVGEWCRFWEAPSFAPQVYDCNTDSDDTQVYFKIITYGSSQGTAYDIEDCGTAGNFSNCQIENGGTPSFSSPTAVGASEAHYYCTVRMMGQGSDRVWFGNSSWNIDVEDSNGWTQRSWSLAAPNTCTSDYENATSTDGLRTWDSRNTS